VHDVLDPRDLLADEWEQLSLSGYVVGEIEPAVRGAVAGGDRAEMLRQLDALSAADRDAAWPYDEPSDPATLLGSLDEVPRLRLDEHELEDRMRGAWLGRAVANTLGKPVEGLTRLQVRTYLLAAGSWPLGGYPPLMEPLPPGVPHLHPSAPAATLGSFTDVPRDDDIDWTILNLHVLERYGRDFTTDDVLREWLDRIPFTQTYTAERAAYRNAIGGMRPPQTATHRNPYREWIGALIRADAFGYACAGDPAAAARMAFTDARLSHVANGLYGEMWAAGLVAAAFGTRSVDEAMSAALGVVWPGSRLAEVLQRVLALRREGVDADTALDRLDDELGAYPWVHTLNNAAVIAVALTWGETFLEAVGIAVGAGRDTDSTAATVGSVHGALHGEDAIPEHLVTASPVHIRSAVRDFDRVTVDELVERTLRLGVRHLPE